MQHVFLSYASAQPAQAQQLEAELEAKRGKAWGGNPPACGGAVAQSPERRLTGSDALILLWSADANKSDFVELKWNFAVTVKKPVMPWLMDATSLPTSLKRSHRISDKHTPKAVDQIVAALKAQPSSMVTDQQTQQLLGSLTTAEPKQVLRQIKTIINQNNWLIEGNAYQAHGDIHFGSGPDYTNKSEAHKLDTWIKVVGLGVANLTFLGRLLDVPTKFMNLMTDKGK